MKTLVIAACALLLPWMAHAQKSSADAAACEIDLAKDYDTIHRLDTQGFSPTSADLEPFAARGGKLLIYHGWADMNVAPRSSVDYYNRLVHTMGQKQVDASVRAFFAPGMAHCGGGEGPNVFDALTPLEQWREQGKPPASIIATHSTSGKVDRTRPLCRYPQVEKYKGTGSIDQAENFVCAQGVQNVPNSSK